MIFALTPGTFSTAARFPVDSAARKGLTESIGRPATTKEGTKTFVVYVLTLLVRTEL